MRTNRECVDKSVRASTLTAVWLVCAMSCLSTTPTMAQALPIERLPVNAGVPQGRTYTLTDLLTLARRDNLALQSVRAQALAARAGVTTAGAYPNPELELLGTSVRARTPGAPGGNGSVIGFSQRIENPALRGARIGAATAGAQAGEIAIRVSENNLMADIKTRFFEVLKQQEELEASREDLALTEQIRDRIRVRTRTGESARFDLIRAENEVALASKQVVRDLAVLAQARANLAQSVGVSLGEGFTLIGDFYRQTPRASYVEMRDALALNPELKRLAAERSRAERQVEVERQQIFPGVSVRIGQEVEPELRSMRAGIALSVPLWDRRSGPIDEARALAIRTRTDAEHRKFTLGQAFEAAWQQYQSALKSVEAIEGGILDQARSIVDIAEAAYRFGERGILEFLDARRQFRLVRADLIAARFELHAAKSELERLAASDIKEE